MRFTRTKLSEVVGAELRLKAIDRGALGTGHDPGVGNDHVEGFADG